MLRLPEALRADLKRPFGPIFTDAGALVERVDGPLIAVGDVVTHHLERAGRTPDVSVVDGRTERSPVEGEVAAVSDGADQVVENPAATITGALVRALVEGLDDPDPVRILVEGEEDLAALPAIVAAPEGASVVYGQPGEGMVHVRVTHEARDRARDLLSRMDGDAEGLLDLLESVE